jgi:maltooligosyltrehalose trehalohydrolase
LPIGAELVAEGLHVRVWAPTHQRVSLVLEAPQRREVVLGSVGHGYHEALVRGVDAGARYRFRLGDGDQLVSDPASRFQPEGPFGPSEVIDPGRFAWTDAEWRGIEPHRHVLYELHVGTFTPEGTWDAATAHLPHLAELGITTVELMPVADFPGHHNWGYDGVNLFAPCRSYGDPDAMRRFVDRAHGLGLAVILDVVYNHFGPSGNFVFQWCPYFKSDRPTEWGEAIDFDGPHGAGVREYFIANAGYWIDEFHLDGLRIDATQAIVDHSEIHVLAEIVRRARAAGAGRRIFLVGESEPQRVELLGPRYGLDVLWNDDFHHTARVALTGLVDGYLHDYRGTPQELISAVKRGYLYQGQRYPWQKQPRGTSTRGVSTSRFVHYLENHDQIANLGFGERLATLTDPGSLRAMTALLLLTPPLPLLFQGQESGTRTPWRFFVDHCQELGDPIRRGRAEFVAQFARLATAESQAALPDPCLAETFHGCVLDPEIRRDGAMLALHRDLLRLRRDDPAFTDGRPGALDGAVLGDRAFVLRYFRDDPAGDRILLVNLGATFSRDAVPEPLIAPPPGRAWRLVWSSEHPRYGGHGTPPVFTDERLAIPARSAVLLAGGPR